MGSSLVDPGLSLRGSQAKVLAEARGPGEGTGRAQSQDQPALQSQATTGCLLAMAAAAQAVPCRPWSRALPCPLTEFFHSRPSPLPITGASCTDRIPQRLPRRAPCASEPLRNHVGHSLGVSSQIRSGKFALGMIAGGNHSEYARMHQSLQEALRGSHESSSVSSKIRANSGTLWHPRQSRCMARPSSLSLPSPSLLIPRLQNSPRATSAVATAVHSRVASTAAPVQWQRGSEEFFLHHRSTAIQRGQQRRSQETWHSSRGSSLRLFSSAKAEEASSAVSVGLPTGHKRLDPPLPLVATVVRGFGRGSRQMGFPTGKAHWHPSTQQALLWRLRLKAAIQRRQST